MSHETTQTVKDLDSITIETYKNARCCDNNMPYIVEKQIPRPDEILKRTPLNPKLKNQVEKDRKEIIDIITGRDKRKLLIIGPCSAWPYEAVIDYANELGKIAENVKDRIKIIMRVYTQKPRTTIGWTGPMNQPDPYKEADIETGIIYCRKMMIDVLNMRLPIADEALFTHNEGYFSDLLSWVAIGARSAEDQEHRIHASMMDVAVGMKNPTSGDIAVSVNSVIAAQYHHVFLLHGNQIRTKGNPYAHLVLRGGKNPNYDFESLKTATKLLQEKEIKNTAIIVDVSHENSVDPKTKKKNPLLQPNVLANVIDSMKKDNNLYKLIKGFMVESFIKTGKQDLNKDVDTSGLSITDACIGIEETKEMIENLYKNL